MNLEPLTIYLLLGVILFVLTGLIFPIIASLIKKILGKWNLVNLLLGVMLVCVGFNFLVNPVSYTYSAQYDLRGWLKWVAAFSAIFPGIYLVLHVRRKEHMADSDKDV